MSIDSPRQSARGVSESLWYSRQTGFWFLTGSENPLVAFTTRDGGVSGGVYSSLNLGFSTDDDRANVEENRRLLCRQLGTGSVSTIRQVHGARAIEVDAAGVAGSGDVLVTRRPELALAVSTADCLGIVLWDEPRRGLAVVHAGWRGVLLGSVQTGLRWLRAGFPTANLRAAIGPGIRPCCFEVGEEVASLFPARHVRKASPRPHVDLAGVVRDQLEEAGLDAGSIFDLGACTACNPGLYFSHRRDRGQTGRHWAIARLEPLRPAP
jgi:YfiH family protein